MRLVRSVLLLAVPSVILAQTTLLPRKPADAPANTLPVTRVQLYKNGVGFFEHTGHVTGNASVTIDFTTSQLNDVLQSLTAVDLNGGRISGAGYNSTTPLDQQLKSLPLALGADPTAADFYEAIRGAQVAVTAPGVSITGRLLSVEVRSVAEKADNDAKPGIDHYFLTVVSDSGEIRTVELSSTSSVRLLDGGLHQDVTRYLQLLAGNRSQGLRHLTLEDRGTGSRELHVSYISQVPIWKSTYRILFTDTTNAATQTATLQGWAVVDNTVGEDWNNVQLSLIAGAPQSFVQPLSDPIYSRRPEIPIAQEAQLTPQTFESSVDANTAAPAMAPRAMRGLPGGVAGGVMGGMLGGTGMGAGNGIGSGSGGNIGGGVMHADKLESYQEEAAASITPNTTTAAFDDFFSYNLTEPITIRKNESALVPILQGKINADRVTVVRDNGNSIAQPLRALWITNTTGATLDRGNFTLVENGSFGGEGLLDPIHAGEKRLLSYAADQAIHVSTEQRNNDNHTTQITAAKGVLRLHRTTSKEVTYIIHNAATEPRTVVLEHPIQQPYVLDDDSKPDETTASVARYRIVVPAGETVKKHVSEHHRGVETIQLTHSSDSQITFILDQSKDNPALIAALQPIIDARRKVALVQIAVDESNEHLKSLTDEEARQRANVTALNDKAAATRFIRDLNDTEDKIKAAQAELDTRIAALNAAKAALSNAIESLQVDTGNKD